MVSKFRANRGIAFLNLDIFIFIYKGDSLGCQNHLMYYQYGGITINILIL